MSDEPDNIIFRYLRRIGGDAADLHEDAREVRARLGSLEEPCASLDRRVDRIGGELERARCGITDAQAP